MKLTTNQDQSLFFSPSKHDLLTNKYKKIYNLIRADRKVNSCSNKIKKYITSLGLEERRTHI